VSALLGVLEALAATFLFWCAAEREDWPKIAFWGVVTVVMFAALMFRDVTA
jgi:hypothetical protein